MPARLDALGIVVSDMAAAADFYSRLGLNFPEDAAGEDHVEATGAGLRVMFDTVDLMKQIKGDWPPASGHRMGLAFLCDTPAEVDRIYAELMELGAGASLAPWDAFWGQRYAQVLDPDGNTVDLFAPLAP